MWYYQKTDNGYKIIKKNKKGCLNFTIPYTLYFENHIMYWDDTKINRLIDDLNSGKIQFSINNEVNNKGNLIGFSFYFQLPTDYNNSLTKS